MTEIGWQSKFIASESDKQNGITKLILRGILIDNTTNKNGWEIESKDFIELAKNFIGKQIRCDHGERVADVKGVIINTEVDEPHAEARNDWDPPNMHPHIHYHSELSSSNDDIIIPIKMGYVSHVSPAVDARTLLCSICKTPMVDKFLRSCKCEGGGILLKDISPRECSIVASPAYESTVMKPYVGFAAAVDKSFLSKEEIIKIVDEELNKRGLYE